MSQRQHNRENLGHLISDLGSDVRDLVRWATVVRDLGSSDNCESEGVQMVGSAMREVAKRVEESWEAAFRLSHHLRRSQA